MTPTSAPHTRLNQGTVRLADGHGRWCLQLPRPGDRPRPERSAEALDHFQVSLVFMPVGTTRTASLTLLQAAPMGPVRCPAPNQSWLATCVLGVGLSGHLNWGEGVLPTQPLFSLRRHSVRLWKGQFSGSWVVQEALLTARACGLWSVPVGAGVHGHPQGGTRSARRAAALASLDSTAQVGLGLPEASYPESSHLAGRRAPWPVGRELGPLCHTLTWAGPLAAAAHYRPAVKQESFMVQVVRKDSEGTSVGGLPARSAHARAQVQSQAAVPGRPPQGRASTAWPWRAGVSGSGVRRPAAPAEPQRNGGSRHAAAARWRVRQTGASRGRRGRSPPVNSLTGLLGLSHP